MEHSELLDKLALTLDQLGVRYAVVGSTASTVYGEPRFTNDIDVVVELHRDQIDLLCQHFPSPEFYLSRSAAESAIRQRSQFNIIHPSSGLKISCTAPSLHAMYAHCAESSIRHNRPHGEEEQR